MASKPAQAVTTANLRTDTSHWDSRRRVSHVRLHVAYQIKNKMFMSLDTKAQSDMDLKMWLNPSGVIDVLAGGVKGFIGAANYHGGKYEDDVILAE